MTNRQLAVAVSRLPGVRHLAGALVHWRGIAALAYHRVGYADGDPFDRALWSATPEAFSAQMRFVKAHFDVISPGDLGQAVKDRRGRYVLVTFDDGYRDNYECAFPILKEHGVPATFFVCTGFLDRRHIAWWDEIAWMLRTSKKRELDARPWLDETLPLAGPPLERTICRLLRVYKSLPGQRTEEFVEFLAEGTGSGRYAAAALPSTWMTWDMVRQMSRAGMSIGGHTDSHPVLSRLSPEDQRQEVERCGQRLAAELGQRMRWFSYPVGGPIAFNADTREALQAAGVEYAFTYYGGIRTARDWDPYDVRRLRIELEMPQSEFEATLFFPTVFGRPCL
jgi:peptidoglycan/xylan/chitin deacetylase (PgdA/CDA1 family)